MPEEGRRGEKNEIDRNNFSASLNPPRAEDTYAPAESAAPLGAVRSPVKGEGDLHLNARPYFVDAHVSDYVVGVTNTCPSAIRIRICQKDGSACNRAVVPAYRSTNVVMGFGPPTDAFNYIARETQ
jgi:hypothetical protein